MAKTRSSGTGSPTRLEQPNHGGQTVTSEARQRMIAEAAYYRAMRRNFGGGDPMNDWLEAEKEINRVLQQHATS